MANNNSENRRTLLLVDDTPDNLHVLNGILRDDYQLRIATSGEKALEAAAKYPAPDLVLLDITMPGMDGYEVCRRLKVESMFSDPQVRQALQRQN